MSLVSASLVADYCRTREYEYRPIWQNPPLSGVLFQSRSVVCLKDVVDARYASPPFLLGRAQARGRRHEIAVLVIPLARPVPNMLLVGTQASVLPRLGIALGEDQQLSLEGDFNARFTLYCPRDYECDALYVFTPDLMAHMIDAIGVQDAEFVDDRLLLYASVQSFYAENTLERAAELAGFLQGKLDRQTKRYDDLERAGSAAADPFRKAQLTTASSETFAIGNHGRRIRTRTTVWQKIGIGIAAILALAAACYWVWMILNAFQVGQ